MSRSKDTETASVRTKKTSFEIRILKAMLANKRLTFYGMLLLATAMWWDGWFGTTLERSSDGSRSSSDSDVESTMISREGTRVDFSKYKLPLREEENIATVPEIPALALALRVPPRVDTPVVRHLPEEGKPGERGIVSIAGVNVAFRWVPENEPPDYVASTQVPYFDLGSTAAYCPCWVQETEVTQELWRAVMKTAPWEDLSVPDGSDLPATGMTFSEANEFAKRCAGWSEYWLMAEEDWANICNGNYQTLFWYGDDADALGKYAWYSVNSDMSLQPVGTKSCNMWGLLDTHGNAAEMLRPKPPSYASKTVLIVGGSYLSPDWECVTSHRIHEPIDYKSPSLGFRLVTAGGIRFKSDETTKTKSDETTKTFVPIPPPL